MSKVLEGINVADKVVKPDEEWRRQLTEEQFRITRKKGTERAFTGAYWDTKQDGVYCCVCCGQPLFDSETKFDSGTGWPRFTEPADRANIEVHDDLSYGRHRVGVTCACARHLGHVFEDGPGETGERFCINSAAIDFEPSK